MKTKVSNFTEFRAYYLSEFELYDGEAFITFNIVGIDLDRNEVQVAVTDRGRISVVLLSSGTRGKRFALPNAEVLIHQPAGGVQGQTTDVINAAKHMEKIRAAINAILAGNTGRTTEQIAADTDRDYIMSAAEAKEYGLIDGVIRTTPQTERRPTDA